MGDTIRVEFKIPKDKFIEIEQHAYSKGKSVRDFMLHSTFATMDRYPPNGAQLTRVTRKYGEACVLTLAVPPEALNNGVNDASV